MKLEFGRESALSDGRTPLIFGPRLNYIFWRNFDVGNHLGIAVRFGFD
jgi:hypothetical protein